MKLAVNLLIFLSLTAANHVFAQPIKDYSGQACSSSDTDSMKCALCVLQGAFGTDKDKAHGVDARRETVRMVINLSERRKLTFCQTVHDVRQFEIPKRLKPQSEVKINIEAAVGGFREGSNDFCQTGVRFDEPGVVRVKTLDFKLCPAPQRAAAKPAADEPTAAGP